MSDRLQFRIHGMDCADEVAILRRELEPAVGAADRLSFDILRGKMTVLQGTPSVTAEQVVQAVGRTGMRAEPWRDVQPDAAEASFWQRNARTVLTAVAGLASIVGFLVHATQAGLVGALGSEGSGAGVEPPPQPPLALAF